MIRNLFNISSGLEYIGFSRTSSLASRKQAAASATHINHINPKQPALSSLLHHIYTRTLLHPATHTLATSVCARSDRCSVASSSRAGNGSDPSAQQPCRRQAVLPQGVLRRRSPTPPWPAATLGARHHQQLLRPLPAGMVRSSGRGAPAVPASPCHSHAYTTPPARVALRRRRPRPLQQPRSSSTNAATSKSRCGWSIPPQGG